MIRLAMAKKAIIALLSLVEDSINTVALVLVDGGDDVDGGDGGDGVVDGDGGDGVDDGDSGEVAFTTIVVVMSSSTVPSS